MKIAHLSQTDAGAGAGRAAYRIHTALLAMGVDSTMLVGEKRTSDPTVSCVAEGWPRLLRARASQYLEAKLARAVARDASVFISPTRFSHFEPALDHRVRAADIVSLYWVNGAFIAPEGLTALRQPVVWRLSDVWPFTGGCHYPGVCKGFESSCGSCPQLRKPDVRDASNHLWRRKNDAWSALDLTIVAPSRWMAQLAKSSSLFSDRRIEVIPTGVDLDKYSPSSRALARARYGLPPDKFLIMFGAMTPDDDLRKGYQQLLRALDVVSRSSFAPEILAVVFGGQGIPSGHLPVPMVSLGRLKGDEALARAYNCADIVVVPSIEDNLPNVALEAIACGVPVAAFDVGGMSDIVTDGWNGRLASMSDSESLGSVLVEMIRDPKMLEVMSMNARKRAEERFSLSDQGEAYAALFEQIITQGRN